MWPTRQADTPSKAGLSRRQFIRSTALAAGALGLGGCTVPQKPPRIPASSKLNIACIGVGGKGRSDTNLCAKENIVALCDVDEAMAAPQRKKFPQAKFYRDWRELLDKEKSIDAVVISTPNHVHAAIASAAIKLGKHVYCQKPLTQTIYEARYLRELAAKHKVATQMGNQGSAASNLRRAVEVIQAGLIGSAREVHVWSDRPVWDQGMKRPPGSDPIPEGLDWDKWLGPAPERPFKRGIYHAFNWRGWFDFGSGALGDMGCQTANMPLRALNLGYPTSIELLDHSELFEESYPKASKIKFTFPARDGMPPVDLFWYDGNPRDKEAKAFRPNSDITNDVSDLFDRVPDSGCLIIGDKGKIFSPDDHGARFYVRLKDEKEFQLARDHMGAQEVPETIPRNKLSPDNDAAHHLEWIASCKGGPKAYSAFDISAKHTEIILAGCLALRLGKTLEWDGENMTATNAPEAAALIKSDYRAGWELA